MACPGATRAISEGNTAATTPFTTTRSSILDGCNNHLGTSSTETFFLDVEVGVQRLKETEEKEEQSKRSALTRNCCCCRYPRTLSRSSSLQLSRSSLMASEPLTATATSDPFKNLSKWMLTLGIVLLGLTACITFIAFGYHFHNTDMEGRFTGQANQITYQVLSAWTTYEMFGAWVHESCHKSVEPNEQIDVNEDVAGHLGYCSRSEFRRLYEYIRAQGVEFSAVQMLRNITHEYREPLEREARSYYESNYPNVEYAGITERVFRPDGSFYLTKRVESPYYMPIHYVEPVVGNVAAIDLDRLAVSSADYAITAIETNTQQLSSRLRLVQEKTNAYGLILAHPGVRTSVEKFPSTNSLAQIVIRVPSCLKYALRSATEDQRVYLYECFNASATSTSTTHSFLGALEVDGSQLTPKFSELPEIEMQDIPRPHNSRYFEQRLDVAGKTWTIVMVSSSYPVNKTYVVLGGTLIFAASLLCAAWFHSYLSRISKLNRMKSAAEREKAAIARIQSDRERHLNEFMAHEVRNPLSSAISALSFVSAAVSEHVQDQTHKKKILEDISIMDASLQIINELLRNMLDIHRARNRQIILDLAPVDVRRDILDPVAASLFLHGAKVDVQVDCPENLAVKSDRMRLKQIILNLSSNATKFVKKGYIRLKANVVNGSVVFFVEDSGPGIPEDTRHRLFARFQESLEHLNQGSGVGLAVCKTLSELMGADICLDEAFDSGIEGCLGARFVLRLNQPPLETKDNAVLLGAGIDPEIKRTTESIESTETTTEMSATTAEVTRVDLKLPPLGLPKKLRILLVDDDTMIRKMFRRATLRMAPDWQIEEAKNGETALVLCENQTFDVIFMDQYMASTEKQMLGTETVRSLRCVGGVKSIICGLSANDMEAKFLESGADTFLLKPFPCQKAAMSEAFYNVLRCRERNKN